MRRKKVKRDLNKIFTDMIEKSIRDLKRNSKAMEKALEQVIEMENIKVSEKDYLELKQLTDTLNEIDSVLNNLGE